MRCYTKLRGAPSRRNRPMWAWKAGIGRIDENSQAAVGVIDLPDINAAFGRLFFGSHAPGKSIRFAIKAEVLAIWRRSSECRSEFADTSEQKIPGPIR